MTKQEFDERKKDLARRSAEVQADIEKSFRELGELIQDMKRMLRRSA